jgi:hypothetical protein
VQREAQAHQLTSSGDVERLAVVHRAVANASKGSFRPADRVADVLALTLDCLYLAVDFTDRNDAVQKPTSP